MKSDTIAVAIPVYNKGPYVGRAIESVLRQNSPVDEIIIVDDGSTDGSLQRIQAYDDSRIRLLRREQPGPGGYAARNLAIRSTNAGWIAFLDADDEWHPNFIEEIKRGIDRAENIGCVFTGWEVMWPDRTMTRHAYGAKCLATAFTQLDLDTFLSSWLRVHHCPIWTSAVAIRRNVLLAAGLFPERCKRGGDKDTWLRVMAVTKALASPKACSRYHVYTVNQVTRTEATNSRHCLCPTLEQMAVKASGQRRRLLKQLFNSEIFDYAVYVGQKERVLPQIYRGFHVSLNPARYCILLALTYLPVPVQRLIRSLVLWICRNVDSWKAKGALNEV